MNLLEQLQFGFTYSTSAGSTAGWIWASIVFFVFLLGFGFIWGRLWNKSWSLTGSTLRIIFTSLLSLIAAYATLNLVNVMRFDQWLENHRSQLVRSVTTSGKFNRDVFSDAWEVISADSDQKDLLHPDEGGEDLRLNDVTDASRLSETAAQEASSVLRKKVPFTWGLPFSPILPETAAQSTIEEVNLPNSEYPVIVTASNNWTRTAATMQANHSLDAYRKMVEPEIKSIELGCMILIGILASTLLIGIPMSATSDICVNPKA